MAVVPLLLVRCLLQHLITGVMLSHLIVCYEMEYHSRRNIVVVSSNACRSRQGGSLSASLSPERKREGGLEEFFPGKTDTLALLKSRRHTDTLATALHCDCTANILELRL